MEPKNDSRLSESAAPTATSIAIFAIVVALLFGGMYFFLPDGTRSTATTKSPTVAEHPAPAPPITTGQGGNAK